ncbi:NADH-ubiquinone oxidoreductase 49kDa subunit [Acetobacter estunensis NRIC 0472]|uniref:NADH:ubiquinone oxidoreductase n=1 Tax=Acetobacter estunensis TaxID=104097 RepID=A0A967EIL2_9PROT|nr:nickel-dependent hydrogenase large subunit [Acetobacter estunensis]NHO53439.1 NADH:ubiquinone oxidoreductase [Acetobacter estunensis]GBQ29063.1 NADH-ubiquinone oxidoreductase 49kDa subunit [Acetobacter estunensis NRIC 0472]
MSLPPILFGGILPVREDGRPSVRRLIRSGEKTSTPWRFELDEDGWYELVERLRDDPITFMGLWCDGVRIHALFSENIPGGDSRLRPLMASLVPDGPRYRGLSSVRSAASPFERMIHDLWGVEAMEAVDVRPLVDHGAWSANAPLSARAVPSSEGAASFVFEAPDPTVTDRGMILPYGPATGGMEGPVHHRLGVVGGRIRTVETAGGFAHRGVTARMVGMTPAAAVELAGRISATATVAHQWTLCMAVEHALGVMVPPTAQCMRAVLAEIERIHTHLTWLARTAQAARADLVMGRLYRARETLARLCASVLGKRLLVDTIIPGGVLLSGRPAEGAELGLPAAMARLADEIAAFDEREFPEIRALWLASAGLMEVLSGAGHVSREEAETLTLGGPVGRACGRGLDLRESYDAYGAVSLRTPVRTQGDALARSLIRFDDIAESLRLLAAFARELEGRKDEGPGEVCAPVPAVLERAAGYGAVEGPSGPVCHCVTMQEGRIAQVFVADPAAILSMTLEKALSGARWEEFDVVKCSFGVSAAAADL